jgi:predicted dienelactone hydrolase
MNKYHYWGAIALGFATAIPSLWDFACSSYRWQMMPIYIASILLWVHLLGFRQMPDRNWQLLPHLIRFGLLSLVVSAIFSYLYPVFAFPTPTGRYAVGTTSLSFVDRSRTESCDPTSTTAPRELVVKVWYPSVKRNRDKAAYLDDERLIPAGKFSHLGLVKTHAVRDAPLASEKTPYPVVIYSPSWSGIKTDNTFQTEELASHGYVVLALEHPCAAAMAVYPDGRVIYGKWSADFASSDAAMKKLLQVGVEHLALRTQDIQFVLNQLPRIDRLDARFQGILDLDKIGIFGHSFGGAAAAQACAIDPRLKAGMNMDGLLFGSVAQSGAAQPFMFMNADYPRPTPADLNSPNGPFRRSKQTDAWSFQQRERWFQRYGGYDLTLRDSAHMTFSDYPLRDRRENGGGKISSARSMKIINSYTVAFFDRHLKGIRSRLLDRKSGSPFPEAVFQHHSIGSIS